MNASLNSAQTAEHDRNSRLSESRSLRWLLVAILIGTVCLAYLPSLHAPFIFDDERAVYEHPEIRQLWPLTPILTSSRRPMLFLTLAVNYAISGEATWSYHILNVLIHLATGGLLWLLTRRLVETSGWSTLLRYKDEFAASLTAIWLLHPLQTQSVSYIVQRCESLMAFFFLAFFYCLLRGAQLQDAQPGRSTRWFLAAVGAFVLGLLSKESMAVAIILGPLFERAFVTSSWREVRRRWWVYAACVPCIAVLTVIIAYQTATLPEIRTGFGTRDVSSWEYFRSQPSVILHYLRLTFWPSVLCIDYKWPIVNSWATITITGSPLIALLIASIVCFYKHPKLGFLGLAFFFILAPTSSFMPITDLAFEHRMYLPLAVVVAVTLLAATFGLSRLSYSEKSKRMLAVTMLLLVLSALSIRTWFRNRDYAAAEVMWTKVILVAPHNYRAHYNLGVHYMRTKQTDMAIALLEKSIELRPLYGDARYNLALQYDRVGRLDDAAAQYEFIIKLKPNDASVLYNLGGIAHRQAQWSLAADYYEKTLELAPDHLKARLQCVRVLDENNDRERADEHLTIALKQGEQHAWVLDAVGVTYAERRNYVRAIEMSDRALSLDPGFLPAVVHKGRSLLELGEASAAIELLSESLVKESLVKRRYAKITLLLAEILAKATPQEVRDGHRSLTLLQPYLQDKSRLNAAILSTSAAAHAELGHFTEAEKRIQQAIEMVQLDGSITLQRELDRQLSLYREEQPFAPPASALDNF
ncbi:MAG: tetratricopeptide (TPR) repeat protein [Pirellulaceae bacterium]|jgi:tetratricopeptide (TPR) repeat protein